MTPPEGEGRPPPEEDSGQEGRGPASEDERETDGGDQPTEEQFALEAGLPPSTDENFDGVPPDQLPPEQPLPESGEFPALEPEFADALRAAGSKSPAQPPPAAHEAEGPPAPDAPAPEAPGEPPPPAAEEPEDPDATIEYAPGEAPNEQGTEEKAVKTVVIGAGAQPQGVAATIAAGLPPASHGKPPPEGDHEPPPKPKRYWWRFSLASLVIVASIAAATSASILLYLNDIADALSHGGKLQKQLSPLLAVPSGGPQNILILGSDKRAGTPGDPGRSDTTMLLRLDPDQSRIALMSIPRDLKVDIPGYGINKFNAAYTFGGPKLTLRMVKSMTGLQINHVVNVDFLGFVRAIDAIGCVWADVDRRYYHSNVGVAPSLQYSEINIKAGYQRLCGKDALAYVRYRHTDTDLVRSARQQDFLREARQRVPISKLVDDYKKLIKIFTTYTTSDISDAPQFLQVIKLFFDARGASIKEVHFPAVLGPSYVYASKSAIRQAVNQFLGFEASGGPRGALEPEHAGGAGAKKSKKKASKNKIQVKAPGGDGLIPAADSGKAAGEAVVRKVSAGFTVFYPTRLPSGAYYVSNSSYEHIQNPRTYHLRDTDGKIHGAYRMTMQLPSGDYIGVQGIRGWSDPPILSGPVVTRTISGRDYDIYLDGDRVRLVAWQDGDNTYWVANSLLQTLSNDQMIGIARSVDSISPKPKHRGKKQRSK
jgi:LCP family protein required for cell wall assembly